MKWYTLGRPGCQKLELLAGSKTKILWICTLVIILILLAVAGYAWAKKTVTLVVDGRETRVQTFHCTVADLLEEQGIKLAYEDEIYPSLSTSLKENLRVVVNHARQVILKVDRKTVKIKTCKKTVEDVLKERKVFIGAKDIITPEKGCEIKDGTVIKVVRVRIGEEIKEVPVSYKTKKIADPGLVKGFSRVVQAGREGLEKQRWQVVYHDGREVERRLADRNLIKAPVDRVLKVGTLQQVSRGGLNIRFSRALDMVATAYTYTGRNTASGVPPHYGVAAVDPRVIPMGTRLYIDGYGYARALDRGSAIIGNRIDVFLETREQARCWGVRPVRVYILD